MGRDTGRHSWCQSRSTMGWALEAAWRGTAAWGEWAPVAGRAQPEEGLVRRGRAPAELEVLHVVAVEVVALPGVVAEVAVAVGVGVVVVGAVVGAEDAVGAEVDVNVIQQYFVST